MLVVAAANALTALAPSFVFLAVARVLLGVSMGGVWALAASLAPKLVGSRSVGLATTIIFSGIAVASVLGVPAGTYIGGSRRMERGVLDSQLRGDADRDRMIAVLPTMPADRALSLGSLVAAFRNPGVRVGFAITALIVTAHFAAYTYVRPGGLEFFAGLNASQVGTMLLIYGAFGVVGNFIAGPSAAKSPEGGGRQPQRGNSGHTRPVSDLGYHLDRSCSAHGGLGGPLLRWCIGEYSNMDCTSSSRSPRGRFCSVGCSLQCKHRARCVRGRTHSRPLWFRNGLLDSRGNRNSGNAARDIPQSRRGKARTDNLIAYTNLHRGRTTDMHQTPASAFMDVAELLERYRDKSLSPVEVLESTIERIEALNPTLNAVGHTFFATARAQAKSAERHYARGSDVSLPLAGVPVVVKEDEPVQGQPWTQGPRSMRT